MKIKIAINLKFYSGIDKDLDLSEYNPKEGITIEVEEGTRLGNVLKKLGLKDLSGCVVFCSGERVSRWYRLRDGDSVSCLKPSGGG